MEVDHFTCQYCGAKYVDELKYIAHRCKAMVRAEQIRTPVGQAAWSFYQKWMKAYKRRAASADTFVDSRYYVSFIKFAKFVHKVNIPDVDVFIRLMKDRDISPTMWTMDPVYTIYLEYMDNHLPPNNQIEITIHTLFRIAEVADCDVGEIFEILEPEEIIELLRSRSLSPWVLLFSNKFKHVLINRTTPDQRIIMETIIRPTHWKKQFAKHPQTVERVKQYIKELDI